MVFHSFLQASSPSGSKSIRRKTRYAEGWDSFSKEIRFGRAKGMCEFCGAQHGKPHPITHKMVYLTTAHIDFPGGVCDCQARLGFKCCRPDHVLALCLRCHSIMMRARSVHPVIVAPAKKSVNIP